LGSVAQEITVIPGMQAVIDEIQSQGGVVASFTTTLATGTNTGIGTWYTGDFDMADYIIGCAVQQLNIDTRRIYTAGCSAGGLQSGTMVLARSSYLAAAMPNSGGVLPVTDWQDTTHIPAAMTGHGTYDADVVYIHFSEWSMHLAQDIVNHGGFAIDCTHSAGHCGAPAELIAAQWQFLKDHPFGTTVDPYGGNVPATFPSYCQVVTPGD
jgi:hypothetical protein